MLLRFRWLFPAIVLLSNFGWAQASQAPIGSVTPAPVIASTPTNVIASQVAPVASQVITTQAPAVVPKRITYLPIGLAAATPVEAQGNYLDGYACAPTAVSMVFGYFHATNSAYQAASPQQLADASMVLVGQGVPYPAMISRMQSFGYTTLLGHEHASLDELKTTLNDGPVIVALGVSSNASTLEPGSINHSVVVVGVASDDSTVLINDPRSGRQLAVSMGSFQAMWSRGSNTVIILRP